MLCDRCIHDNVCGTEGTYEPGLVYCHDFLGWIPVSERLPDIHDYSENYLVTLKRGGVHIAMFTECHGRCWWTYDDVIAWMPLQEPYKIEGE